MVAYSNPALAAVVCSIPAAIKLGKIVIMANHKIARGILSSLKNLVFKNTEIESKNKISPVNP